MLTAVFSISLWFYFDVYLEEYEAVTSNQTLVLGEKTYFLNEPAEEYTLPEELAEISGLSFYHDNQIICVQDEVGKIFIYDLEKKEVVRTEKFGKNGDYEGVEFVDGIVYVLNSSGRIFYFPLYDDGIGEVKKIDTPLSSENDVEGLGYDSLSASLLIATKGPGIDGEHPAVYYLKLADFNFMSTPFFIVDQDKIEEMIVKKGINRASRLPAKPSAVYLDPSSDQTIVVCSVGKLLLKYSRDGSLEDLVPLGRDVYTQPEGITHFLNNALLISSEGAGGSGYLLRFEAVE